MSITTSEHDDLNDTQEHTIAGLVILFFGLLYLLFNYGLPTFSFNSANPPSAIPVLGSQPPSKTEDKIVSKPVALNGVDTDTASTNNNDQGDTARQSVKSTQVPDAENIDQLTIATDNTAPTESQMTTTEQSTAPEQKNSAEHSTNTSQSKSAITEATTEKNDESQEAGAKSTKGGLIIMDAAVSKLHDHLLNNQLDESVIMNSINFADKSSQIDLTSDHQIKGIAGLLERYPDTKILIRGHSDESSASENKELSLDRATAVGEKLVEAGAQAGNIILMGIGNAEPLTGNNSRIDISITQSRPTIDRPKE